MAVSLLCPLQNCKWFDSELAHFAFIFHIIGLLQCRWSYPEALQQHHMAIKTSWFICLLTISWWRHQMETFSTLLAHCAGNSLVSGEFPSQRSVTRSFDVFFDLCLNKWLSKQSWGWWFKMPLCSLWRHSNVVWQFAQSDTKGNITAPHHCPFFKGIHWWPVDSPHKGPVMQKVLPFHDIIMEYAWIETSCEPMHIFYRIYWTPHEVTSPHTGTPMQSNALLFAEKKIVDRPTQPRYTARVQSPFSMAWWLTMQCTYSEEMH